MSQLNSQAERTLPPSNLSVLLKPSMDWITPIHSGGGVVCFIRPPSSQANLF